MFLPRTARAVATAFGIFALLTACATGDDTATDTDDGTAVETEDAAGAGTEEAATEEAAGEPRPIEVLLPFPVGIPFTPLVVAQEEGYLEENGLDLKASVAEGSGFLSQQLIAGNVDFALMSSADAVVSYNADDRTRVLFCNQVKNVYRIVAPADSGITSVDELEGRTLGISAPGGGENQFVRAALAEAGLQDDVRVLPVGEAGPQSQTALEDGTVDAYSSSFPDIAGLTAAGIEFEDITPDKYSNVAGVCMTTTQTVLDDDGGLELAKDLSKSWIDGMYFALENEDEAFEIVCGAVPESCESEEAATAFYNEALSVIRPDIEGQRPGLPERESWDTMVEILAESDTVPADLDVTELVSGEGIDAVVEHAYAGR